MHLLHKLLTIVILRVEWCSGTIVNWPFVFTGGLGFNSLAYCKSFYIILHWKLMP